MPEYGPVQKMLSKYPCKNTDETREALRQVIQEITLMGLSRAQFFSKAAFYGGTALRIFHGLERFSEDLDFSLIERDPVFDLSAYLPQVHDELASFGLDLSVEKKNKSKESAIQSAFIKGNTLVHLIKITAATPPVTGVPENEHIKIKIEVDTDPPAFAQYETKHRLQPIAYSVRLFDKPSLFAGKMHALLCRNWKTRVKGRDFFDYLWYLSHDIPVNMQHLEARMKQSGHWTGTEPLSKKILLELLDTRLQTIDLEQAKKDVTPFIHDTRSLDLWSKDFFMSVSKDTLRVDSNI